MAKEQQTTELKNTVTIEEAGPCKKKVVVEIPEEAIRKATDERYETLRKEALVPGFRKGRAPRRLLEKRFGKETSEQIKLKLLADAGDSAIKDNELDTLREPNIDFEKIELPDSGPLKFDFEVEVRPDEQVDGELKQLQKYAGLWAPRKSGAAVELEDQIIADVVLKAEGAEEKEKLDNVEIHVRPNGFVGAIPVEKLDELLVGAKADQTKKITVEVPKTYFREEYRGKKVDIEIAIKDIKWLKAAELNEDFLKRFGVEDESQLREKLRDSLRNRLEQQVRGDMAEQIYKYMLDNTNFELPTDIVAEHSETLLQRQYVSLLQRGLAREQIEEHMEQLRAGSEQQAAEQLKTFFIMDKVADKLKVEVNEEEINGHIAQLAIQRGQRPERMREQMLRDGSLAQFRLQVRENKCIAKLLESAKITEVEPKKKAKKTSTKTVKKSAEKKQPKKRKATAKPR